MLTNAEEMTNLDVLRAVAVMSVFGGHLYNFLRPGYSPTAWHFGQFGVLAFFVHTSLVLMLSLERQQTKTQPLFSTFYVRRWFRLYPLSILFVLVAFVFHLSPEGDSLFRDWTFTELLANLTLTTNLFRQPNMVGGLWTLPLEVQMYIVLPMCFVLLQRRAWAWVFAAIALSIPLAFVAIVVTDRLSVLAYGPCFLAGILAWKLSRRFPPFLPGWAWPLGLAAIALIWFAAPNIQPYHIYLRWMFCLALGTAIPAFHAMGNTVVTRSAAIIAKYSYGIYLSHLLVMTIAFCFLQAMPQWIQFGVFLALAVAIPFTVYHVIEAPMIRVGRRWRPSFPLRRQTPSAIAVINEREA